MSWIERGLQLQTRRERAQFEKSAADPAWAQEQLILRLVRRHQRTAFGQAHGFEQIQSSHDYQGAVPICDYQKLLPYLQRVLAGERNILTVELPIMFARTSGTSGDPKFIPVTARWQEELTRLSRLWMAYAASHHRGCFAGRALLVASPSIEGFTSSGLPYGSISGVSSRRVPWLVRRRFAIPEAVNLIADPDARYFLTMRSLAQLEPRVVPLVSRQSLAGTRARRGQESTGEAVPIRLLASAAADRLLVGRQRRSTRAKAPGLVRIGAATGSRPDR